MTVNVSAFIAIHEHLVDRVKKYINAAGGIAVFPERVIGESLSYPASRSSLPKFLNT